MRLSLAPHVNVMARKTQSHPSNNKSNRLPWLFARGGRDRILICLAVNGPMHVRAISRAVNMESHKTWNAVERLVPSGLVVKRNHPGGRKYAALNRRLPIYRSLLKLLLALDQYWPAKRISPTARWYMPFDRDMNPARLDNIFHSNVRSRILLFIAAVRCTNLRTIYDLLGTGLVMTHFIVNFWEREGVVRTRHVGHHRVITLNPDFVVAKELAAFLRQIVSSSDEYRALRVAARTCLRPMYKALKSEKTKAPSINNRSGA